MSGEGGDGSKNSDMMVERGRRPSQRRWDVVGRSEEECDRGRAFNEGCTAGLHVFLRKLFYIITVIEF